MPIAARRVPEQTRGAAARGLGARQGVLTAAYAAHPERFVKGRPQPADLPQAVWINDADRFRQDPTVQLVVRDPHRRAAADTAPTGTESQHPICDALLDDVLVTCILRLDPNPNVENVVDLIVRRR